MRGWAVKCCIFLAWGGPHLSAEQEQVTTWQAGNPYSDSFLYNGFTYRTIRTVDTNGSGFAILVGAAIRPAHECPGPGRRCTALLALVWNEGGIPFDLRAGSIECLCGGKKPKSLARYTIPR